MELDPVVCERARQSRDPRFDGRFFIGVLTTGIYCRPVCPVKAPKAKNVRYYPSAAAAGADGFRPCLRCRPEISAGTPDLASTSSTVHRALKLIGDGEPEEGGVARIAELLRVTSRHLNRLFHQHLGASPVAVIRTRRLHFAKRLVDETDLPMATVALSAGFGSLRRFNATFQDLYGRTPTELRRRRPRDYEAAEDDSFCFRLGYRPPFDWDSLLTFFEPRVTPGVECVRDSTYHRTFSFGKRDGSLAVVHRPTHNAIEVRVQSSDSRHLLEIVERVKRIFDLGAETTTIADHLRRDKNLREAVDRLPGLRVPGAWGGFELAVRAILGQQVTVKGATTLSGRLAKTFGKAMRKPCGILTTIFPDPSDLAERNLSVIGLPKARARTIQTLARAVRDGHVRFDSTSSAGEFIHDLVALPGIGDWTAQYVAMRALGEPDAFPASDLGLLKAARNGNGLMTPKKLEERAKAWRPWRAYAAMVLWNKDKLEKAGALGRKGILR